MNKNAYQQPRTKVVKILHQSHILSGSLGMVNSVKSSSDVGLVYGGAGGEVEARSRNNGLWDDEE